MVCDEDTAVNRPAVEGLSGCASKETRVRFLEEMRIESSMKSFLNVLVPIIRVVLGKCSILLLVITNLSSNFLLRN
jgi:hypothetical protein